MTMAQKPPYVGSPDPELRTSPIVEATSDEEEGDFVPEMEDYPVCYFNNVSYREGSYVCSGSGELLRCEKGVWVMVGGCDPDNP
ncbi:MAG TPA: hypothetical protein ENK48_01975 [Gammaproteobacteria bacterium]|nr:hypothetical protein [Gammaproteobacteria bacterium]